MEYPGATKHAGEDELIVAVKPTIKRQRAVPLKGNKADAGTIQQQRWAEGCSTHKSYHFSSIHPDDKSAASRSWKSHFAGITPEDRAALEDWSRLPHKVRQVTPEEWKAYMEHPPAVVFAPDQITSRGR